MTQRKISWSEIEQAARNDPWLKLLIAAKRGRGVKLSEVEVSKLMIRDNAIQTAAENYYENEDVVFPWQKQDKR